MIHKPHIHGLTAQAGVWTRATEMEISTNPRAHVAWQGHKYLKVDSYLPFLLRTLLLL